MSLPTHLAPTIDPSSPAVPLPPIQTRAAFARRFREWSAWLTLEQKHRADFSTTLWETWRSTHHHRLVTCHLMLNIEMRVIRRLRLDDPLIPYEEWQARVQSHRILSSKIRTGRAKGTAARRKSR